MNTLPLLHLLFVSLWAGILLCEAILELLPKDDNSLRWTAQAHYWIDILFELPLVLGILLTGIILSSKHWPLSPLHWIKISCGLIAIFFNLDCSRRVCLRFRYQDDSTKLKNYSRTIKFSALGFPFGIAAAYMGFVYFLR